MTATDFPSVARDDRATTEPSGPPATATTTAKEASSARETAIREITDGTTALAARHRCAVAQRVHHSGISLGHLQMLWILQEHGPQPVSRLGDMLGIGAPNATGLLDRMEQRGLVERTRDVEDRRVVLVRQTELGRDAAAEMDGWRADWMEQVLAPLPVEMLEALAASIRATLASAAPGSLGNRPGDCAEIAARGSGSAHETGAAVPAAAGAPAR